MFGSTHRHHLWLGFAAAILALPHCLMTIDESRISGSTSGTGGAGPGGGGQAGQGGCGAVARPPARIFFSDLESGPNDGGENDQGAFVSIVGNGFGDEQGCSRVTIGGGEAAEYRLWSDDKIIVQLGPAAENSPAGIVVHVDGAPPSNGVPFTVRNGDIYFAALTGGDSATGLFGDPVATIRQCRTRLAPGDICYLGDGLTETTTDPDQGLYESALALLSAGAPELPKALVAYPEATVTVGSLDLERALWSDQHHWVIAGLTLVGRQAVDLTVVQYMRFVNNHVVCGYDDMLDDGCIYLNASDHLALFGNEVTSDGMTLDPTLVVHAISANDVGWIDIGWNWIHDTGNNCVAITMAMFADGLDGSAVHDNLIHDIRCDGIRFYVEGTTGTLPIYNNLLFEVGEGPDFASFGSFTCLRSENQGGDAIADVHHNTFYDCSRADPLAFSIQHAGDALLDMRFRNNILRVSSSYIDAGGLVTGENNLLWGSAQPLPTFLDNTVNVDPELVDPQQGDFHLEPHSAARDAGIATGLVTDLEGRMRDAMPDIGAYELPAD